MTIKELKNTTWEWKVKNGWPMLDTGVKPQDMIIVVEFCELPKSGEEFSGELPRFLKDKGVELEEEKYTYKGNFWSKSEGSFDPKSYYRIPISKPRMRNKRPDELPDLFAIPMASCTLFCFSKDITQKQLDGFAFENLKYTLNGSDRHSFQVEEREE